MAIYLFIMSILTWAITGGLLIGLVCKFASSCMDEERSKCKVIICMKFFIVALMGIGLGFLFYVVSTLI